MWKGGELKGAAAGPRKVNANERREVVYDRIRLDQTRYWPVNEELSKKALEELASRCFTIEVDLEEQGSIVYGYPDYEARIEHVRMLLKICDGMSQGEFLFLWQAIGDEAKRDWPSFLRMARLVPLEDEPSEDLHGDDHEVTD
jgi:hypothetical protein